MFRLKFWLMFWLMFHLPSVPLVCFPSNTACATKKSCTQNLYKENAVHKIYTWVNVQLLKCEMCPFEQCIHVHRHWVAARGDSRHEASQIFVWICPENLGLQCSMACHSQRCWKRCSLGCNFQSLSPRSLALVHKPTYKPTSCLPNIGNSCLATGDKN